VSSDYYLRNSYFTPSTKLIIIQSVTTCFDQLYVWSSWGHSCKKG